MSYPDYKTFLRYKNCCRPIGDTGPPGPAGPTGPAATLDVRGSKGEILYFSETDNLLSTDNVFIQEANVTINNNLVVTGTTYLNNTLDVSGNTTIQNGILKVLNPNDKNSSQFQTSQGNIFIGASNNIRFGDISYNLIFSTGGSDNNGLAIGTLNNTEPLIFGVDNTEVIRITDNGEQRVGIKTSNPSATLEVSGNVIINGNLSMSDQFINDVSGIFFSDATYIGHGSSFDITTSERLDISAAGGVTVNGNLLVKDAATFQSDTMITGNLTIDGATTIDNTLEVNGNLSMNNQFINDVSGIYFSDETYIGHGSSFDITTSERLDISAAGGINLNTDVTINSNITINSNLTANTINTQRLLFPSGNYIDDNQDGVGQLYVNGNTTLAHQVQLLSTLDVSGATTIRSNLSMDNNFINDVSGIIFTQGNLLFSDFSSSIQQVHLPSSQGQPISLERKTLFYDDNFYNNIPGSSLFIIDFTNATIQFNQLQLNVNGNIIKPSPDISGQYIEIYANFDVSSNNSPTKTFSLDISSVSGVSFSETIDVRTITKQGSFYLTFGPHIFIPSQWENTTGFNFIIHNTGSNSFFINKYKLMFKSYFM